MVFIFRNSFNTFWFKQEIICKQLKNCTSQWPNISIMSIWITKYNFRGSILSSLNFFCKMMVWKTSISHINYFKEKFFVQFNLHIFPFQYIFTPLLFTVLFFFIIYLWGCLIRIFNFWWRRNLSYNWWAFSLFLFIWNTDIYFNFWFSILFLFLILLTFLVSFLFSFFLEFLFLIFWTLWWL